MYPSMVNMYNKMSTETFKLFMYKLPKLSLVYFVIVQEKVVKLLLFF